MLNKYLKRSVWRLALRCDIYIYVVRLLKVKLDIYIYIYIYIYIDTHTHKCLLTVTTESDAQAGLSRSKYTQTQNKHGEKVSGVFHLLNTTAVPSSSFSVMNCAIQDVLRC